jgi:endoglycosylceramidase
VKARFAFALAFLLLWAGCSAPPSGWHVSDGFLRAADGRATLLRGANFTGTQKSAPYLDPAGADELTTLHDAFGFGALRFVMTWAAIEPTRGQYDDAYLDQVAQRMDWAQAAGLSVILDMHEDIYGEGFGFDGAPPWTCDASHYSAFVPQTPWYLNSLDPNVIACVDGFWTSDDLQQHFIAAWTHVAARLHDAPAVVGFDVLNEPEWGSYSIFDFEADRLAPLYKKVVAAVRAHAPGWVAFLEPSSSRNEGIPTGLTRFDFRDVVYSPHSYDSAAEGSGTFDPSRRQAILDYGAKLVDEAHALDAALWIGEYGGVPGNAGYDDYMQAEYDAQGAAAAGATYWDASRSSGGYGLFDDSGTVKPDAVAAIARPWPERVAGDPTSFAWDGTMFTLQYVARGALPTEIRVPPSVFPSGYSVSCGGCTATQDADGVTLTGVAPGPTTVALTSN